MTGLEQGLVLAVVVLALFALSQYIQRRRK
jgi:hypothetical protein